MTSKFFIPSTKPGPSIQNWALCSNISLVLSRWRSMADWFWCLLAFKFIDSSLDGLSWYKIKGQNERDFVAYYLNKVSIYCYCLILFIYSSKRHFFYYKENKEGKKKKKKEKILFWRQYLYQVAPVWIHKSYGLSCFSFVSVCFI